MNRAELGKIWPWVASAALALGAVLVACWPVVRGGYPLGHDWIFGLVRLVEYRDALLHGQLPPFWSANHYHGLGAPIFLFYGHGFLALASVASVVTPNVIDAARLALVLTALLGAAGAGLWGFAAFGTARAARVCAIVFSFGPYLACNRLVRSANAELFALSCLPYALAGVALLARRPREAFGVLVLGLAAVIVSHNMVALIGVGATLFTLLVVHRKDLATLLRGSGAVGLALLVSAFYWLPAMVLKDTVNADDARSEFSVLDSFVTPADLVSGQPYSVGLPMLVAALLAAVVVLRRGDRPARLWGVCGVTACILGLWLTHESSRLVWTHVPLLPYFQFTWRMSGLFSVGAAILFAAACCSTTRVASLRSVALEVALVGACVASLLPVMGQGTTVPPELEQRAAADLVPERVRALGMSTTVGDQFAPFGADIPSALEHTGRGSRLLQTSSAMEISVVPGDAETLTLGIDGPGGTVELARWAYPVWHCSIDAEPTPCVRSVRDLLTLEVPAGQVIAEVTLAQPPVRRWGNALSILGLLVTLGLLLRRPRRPVAGP